jgi:putative ABC transport system permease protein
MAFALLAGAGLFLKSFQGMTTTDLGFEPANRLIMRFSLPGQYREDPGATARFFRELTERLSLRSDVAAAGTASQMPFSGGTFFPPASIEATGEVVEANVHNSAVTPGYFEALGLRLVAGRLLSEDDGAGAPPVTVVNQSLARRYWPGEDPMGRRIRLDLPGDSVWRTVVGVVEDLRYSLGATPFPEYYSTVAQRPLWYQTVVVHATMNHAAVAEAMRETLWSVEPNTPVTIVSLEDRIRNSRGWVSARFGSLAMGTLATLAALLSVIGVYGVVAFTVRMRTHEFGVRMALGESRPRLLRWVLSRGLALALVGVVLGLGAVLAAGGFVDQFLFQVNARDPSTLLAVALLLVGTGLGASAIPALRATRVDPVRTLTSD